MGGAVRARWSVLRQAQDEERRDRLGRDFSGRSPRPGGPRPVAWAAVARGAGATGPASLLGAPPDRPDRRRNLWRSRARNQCFQGLAKDFPGDRNGRAARDRFFGPRSERRRRRRVRRACPDRTDSFDRRRGGPQSRALINLFNGLRELFPGDRHAQAARDRLLGPRSQPRNRRGVPRACPDRVELTRTQSRATPSGDATRAGRPAPDPLDAGGVERPRHGPAFRSCPHEKQYSRIPFRRKHFARGIRLGF